MLPVFDMRPDDGVRLDASDVRLILFIGQESAVTIITGDLHTTAGVKARRIRNAQKREYAHAYLSYILADKRGKEPEYGTLSYMAAQAVRMQLDSIFAETRQQGDSGTAG